ncbi:CDC48 [Symbiodinium sp. CCMP2456]|nr:CDC48 [Symbiodinium sp. CCMP2456]
MVGSSTDLREIDDSTSKLHEELSSVAPAGSPGCHCLEFDSWWNEGKHRRFVYIRYSITEGAFQMAIDEDSNLYHVPVAYGARTGEAVTVWDLHVGAEVDILGRMTTLQRCSQTTAEWNKYWVWPQAFTVCPQTDLLPQTCSCRRYCTYLYLSSRTDHVPSPEVPAL